MKGVYKMKSLLSVFKVMVFISFSVYFQGLSGLSAQERVVFVADDAIQATEEEQQAEDDLSLSLSSNPFYVRHYFAQMDQEAIVQLAQGVLQQEEVATEGVARDSRQALSLVNQEPTQEPVFMDIQLFPGMEFQLQIEQVRRTQSGGLFIHTSLVDGGRGFAHFMVGEDGSVRGEVHSTAGTYTIRNWLSDNQRVLIQEMDTSSHVHQENDAVEVEIDLESIQRQAQSQSQSQSQGSVEPSMGFDQNSRWRRKLELQDRLQSPGSSTEEDDEAVVPMVGEDETAIVDDAIDVLVVYTQAAMDSRSGSTDEEKQTAIENDIRMEVEKTNQAFLNSGISAQINLIGMEKIDYSSAGMSEDLARLRYKRNEEDSSGGTPDTSGDLDEIHDWRLKYSADFVHLIVENQMDANAPCGIAYVWSSRLRSAIAQYESLKANNHDWSEIVGLQEAWEKSLSFSVSSIGCTLQYAFAHELGHNMGLFHDRFVAFNDENGNRLNERVIGYPIYPYGFGYVNQNEARSPCRYTIMAYDDQCDEFGVDPPFRELMFSNPSSVFSFPGESDPSDPAGVSGESFTSSINGPANSALAVNNSEDGLSSLKLRANSCRNAISLDGRGKSITIEASEESYSDFVPLTPLYCGGLEIATSTSTTVGSSRFNRPPTFVSNKDRPSVRVDITANNQTCPIKTTVHLSGFNVDADISVEQSTKYQARSIVNRQFLQLADDQCNQLTDEQKLEVVDVDLQERNISEVYENEFTGLTNLRSINLRGNELTSLPETVFQGLDRLASVDLSENDITELESDLFQGLVVASVDLSENEIEELESDLFQDLVALERLDLSGNRLEVLPAGIFDDTSGLTSLDLSENSINALIPFPNVLRSLDLSDNELESDDLNGAFRRMSRLRYLWLSNNSVTSLSVSVFDDLSALRSLALDGNELATIPNEVFSGQKLPRLRYLWLNNNSLSTLSDAVFSGLTKLRYLNLSDNVLEAPLSSGICEFLRGVRYVRLEGGSDLDTLCPTISPSGTAVAMDDSGARGFGGAVGSIFSSLFGGALSVFRVGGNEFFESSCVGDSLVEGNEEVIRRMLEDGVGPVLVSEITGVRSSVVTRIMWTRPYPNVKTLDSR